MNKTKDFLKSKNNETPKLKSKAHAGQSQKMLADKKNPSVFEGWKESL